MRQHDAPRSGLGARDARELLHQVGIRQPVKAVAAQALVGVAPRQRQQLRHARQIMMKRGVEAGDLRQSGEALRERFRELQFLRQVLGIERTQFLQRLNHRGVEPLRCAVLGSAVHDAVRNGIDMRTFGLRLDELHQRLRCGRMVARRHRLSDRLRRIITDGGELGIGQSDPVDRTLEQAPQSIIGGFSRGLAAFEQRELDARGAGVDRQDGSHQKHHSTA